MGNDLISLRVNLDKLDHRDVLFRLAVTCYLAALDGMEKRVLAPFADKTGATVPKLAEERERLEKQPDARAFEQARDGLERALKEAVSLLQTRLAGTVELGEVLGLLELTMGSMRRRGGSNESRLRETSLELAGAAELQDVNEFRARVRNHVTELNKLVESMQQENLQMISELEAETGLYRKKLDEAHEMANRDTLTGLANRRVLQVRVDEYTRAQTPFCLLLIDLNRFKAINDQHGHLIGDELLRLFAARLRNQLRTDDTAARWGGDEFVVVLPCKLPEAMARAQILERNLRGTYQLQANGKSVRVEVNMSVGVAEHKAGESGEHLLARADELLYSRKRKD